MESDVDVAAECGRLFDDVSTPADGASTEGMDASPKEALLYRHGRSARYELIAPPASVAECLDRAGLHPTEADPDWVCYVARLERRRSVLRGSTVLTQRAPRNRSLPMARKNIAWGTA
jgi:hypothetical protein